jgi:hypothetical protein
MPSYQRNTALSTKTALPLAIALIFGLSLGPAPSAHAVGDANTATPGRGGAATDSGADPSASKIFIELDNKNASAITGDPSQLAGFEKNSPYEQSPANLYIGGNVVRDGLRTLNAAKIYPSVCAGGGGSSGSGGAGANDPKSPSLCKEKKEDVTKAWDAAGLAFGVPTAALMCLAAESLKEHKDAGAAPPKDPNMPKGPKAFDEKQSKALKPKMDALEKKYRTMTGQPQGKEASTPGGTDGQEAPPMKEPFSSAFSSAYQARILLLELEPTLIGGGKQMVNADYVDLIKVLAISKTGSAEDARQAGAKLPVKVPPQYQSFVDGVLKCMGAGSAALKAPDDLTKGADRQ